MLGFLRQQVEGLELVDRNNSGQVGPDGTAMGGGAAKVVETHEARWWGGSTRQRWCLTERASAPRAPVAAAWPR